LKKVRILTGLAKLIKDSGEDTCGGAVERRQLMQRDAGLESMLTKMLSWKKTTMKELVKKIC
jgi:hypothetical protein